MKKTKIIYWVFTIIFSALMLFSAIPNILATQDWVKIMQQLGYPTYLLPFLGVAKLLGVIGILISGYPRLKEWCYAGLFFDLAGVIYSSIAAAGKFDPMMATMLIWIVPGILSYIYYHKLNKA